MKKIWKRPSGIPFRAKKSAKIWKKALLVSGAALFLLVMPGSASAAGDGNINATAKAVSSNRIELNWNDIEKADKYIIYRKNAENGVFQKVKTVSSTNYQDSGITAAVNYYYKIVPVSKDGQDQMTSVQQTLKVKAPGEASLERITVKSPTKMNLYWKAAAGSEGYQIFRSDNKAGGYTEIDSVTGKTNCSYTDTAVIPGRTYYYKVRAVGKGANDVGNYSDPMKGKTVAKTAITAITSLSSEKMQIAWDKVSGAVNYEVYRSTQLSGGYKRMATVKKSSCSYTDHTVKSGKKYFYKVVVIGKLDGTRISSGYSEPVSFRALKQVKISSVKAAADIGLKIKWSKVAGATKYKIYRATSKNGKYKNIATVEGKSTVTYTDVTATSGKVYYYKVQAYADEIGMIFGGKGSKSNSKGASTAYEIMGKTTVTASQMAALYKASGRRYPSNIYKDKGAKNIEKFCKIVISESEKEGVKAEVIFAQICLETGYLQFGGQVSPQQCNFSGLGATDDGAAGATFSNVRIGIRAQVQHLKGYASKDALNQKCVDPRFAYLSYRRGTAKNVQDLGGGNWATDPNYATKLMALIKAMKKY